MCQAFKNRKLVPSCGYTKAKIKILSHFFHIKELLPKSGPPSVIIFLSVLKPLNKPSLPPLEHHHSVDTLPDIQTCCCFR